MNLAEVLVDGSEELYGGVVEEVSARESVIVEVKIGVKKELLQGFLCKLVFFILDKCEGFVVLLKCIGFYDLFILS